MEARNSRGSFVPPFTPHWFACAMVLVLAGFPTPQAFAAGNGAFCTATTDAVFKACGFEVQDDYWIAVAVCTNESDAEDRADCFDEARSARTEGTQLCRDQRSARLEVCGSVGEARYDPEFEARDFESNFRNLSNPNRYFPLAIGNKWELRGGGEVVKLEVLNRTKLIDDVRCVVHRDRVSIDGKLVEDTDDWFAQAKDGKVWYCGEEVKDYETFAGDRPAAPELVSIDGSFKAERDGDKPGIIFLANPRVGDVYREEFSLNNAEDVSEVVSTTYSYGTDPELDRFVPRALVQALCRGDCVVVNALNPREPGVFEIKYYAAGIGFFLQTRPDTGEVVQLVSCNFDPRCGSLPQP